ncbi:hypothetical protein EY643_13120 [Halioglobus maricola]|uniref:Uncharacterized protein n=2 Tax=Halioglobus maricola TaxID=2601894 RepID=A0A5P9NKX7_9GAMM|nr:hypothetical protein EY643_13120 [Halioglobus maricola]
MWLPRLVGQPWVGWGLAWREGRWTLDRGAGPEMVQMCRESRAGPGGVFLTVQDMHGARHTLWLLADSVPAQELRKVRVRLLLERRV